MDSVAGQADIFEKAILAGVKDFMEKPINPITFYDVILGVFKDCEKDEKDISLTIRQTFEDRLSTLGIPVYYGFSFGHISDMCTLPIGLKAHFDSSTETLSILEPSVL